MKGFKDSKKKFHPITKSKGVRMKRFDKSEIQSLIFPKRKFSISDAKKWAKTHDFKANKADVTKNNIRIRQFNPNEIKRGGECRTIHLGSSNVQGVLCEVGVMRKKRDKGKIISKKKVGEFELDDILEDVGDFRELTNKVRENIEFTLRREKILKKDMSVVLPVGALAEFRPEDDDDTSGFYQFDFEVFKGGNDIPFAGTAFGQISANQILDMTVELYEWEK